MDQKTGKDNFSFIQPSRSRPNPVRVMIVDDSPSIGVILEMMLSDLSDIDVVGRARDGQEALRMAMRLRPDVITMDIRLPKMDGLEATRRIMNLCPTPIIVLSSAVYAADYNWKIPLRSRDRGHPPPACLSLLPLRSVKMRLGLS